MMYTSRLIAALVFLLSIPSLSAQYFYKAYTRPDGIESKVSEYNPGEEFDENLLEWLFYDFQDNKYTQTFTLSNFNGRDEQIYFAVKFKNFGYIYTPATGHMNNILGSRWFEIIINLDHYCAVSGADAHKFLPVEKVDEYIKSNKLQLLDAKTVINLFIKDTVVDIVLNHTLSLFNAAPLFKKINNQRLFSDFAKELAKRQKSPTAQTTRSQTPSAITAPQVSKPLADVTPKDLISKPFGLPLSKPYSLTAICNYLNSNGINYTLTDYKISLSDIPFEVGKRKLTEATCYVYENDKDFPCIYQTMEFRYPSSIWTKTQSKNFASYLANCVESQGFRGEKMTDGGSFFSMRFRPKTIGDNLFVDIYATEDYKAGKLVGYCVAISVRNLPLN